jgi:hypothetical protein
MPMRTSHISKMSLIKEGTKDTVRKKYREKNFVRRRKNQLDAV